MSDVKTWQYYTQGTWTRTYIDVPGPGDITTHKYVINAIIRFQYIYDGETPDRELFITQWQKKTDRLGNEYDEIWPSFMVKQGEDVQILNYNGSTITITAGGTINDTPIPTETNTYYDADAYNRLGNYVGQLYYGSWSPQQYQGVDGIKTVVSNLTIKDSSQEPWEYKGYAYKNGKFYDEPLNFDDPYAEDNASDDGDQGTNNWTPDNITLRDLPPNFFSDSGLMTVYTPTTSELRAFSSYLWSDRFDVNQLKKIFNNPFDLILGFQYLPLKVIIGGQTGVNVGNILNVDTGLTMSYPTQENYLHSFGTLNLTGQEHKFLDFAPYSKTYIHLPYIGEQVIDTDLIRKASPVELIYKYNIVTGTITAILTGHIENQLGVLYEWVGNCCNALPVANNDYSNTINGMFSLVQNAVGGAVFGGSIGGAIGVGVGAITGAINGLNQADMKPTITTTGSIGGCGACLNATCDAFIVTEQQRLSVASTQAHYLGYPRNVSGYIKNSGGYNNIKAIRMSCANATQSELDEITSILTNGYVYGTLDENNKNHVISKPTTPSGDNVAFALYQNKSSNIRIDKELDHLHTYDCIIKDSTSILTPTIRLNASDINVTKGNYGYIPKFKRFYYVTNVTSVRQDVWEIALKCDVLMSFRDDIIEHKVIFNHSEKTYNLYLNDGTLQMDSRPKVTWNKFPNSLTEDGTYVLILAGNNTNA